MSNTMTPKEKKIIEQVSGFDDTLTFGIRLKVCQSCCGTGKETVWFDTVQTIEECPDCKGTGFK